jgi:dolichyl-phosphate-mannose--protein O-mannosyl transferase
MKLAKSEWFILLVVLAVFTFRCRSVFDVRFQPEVVTQKYADYTSGTSSFLSDDELYAFVGWQYVNGVPPDDPLNSAHPPLAKYLIGISELVFANQALLGFMLSILTLILAYFIARKFTSVFPVALLLPLILSLDKMYIRFSTVAMLDIYPTFFSTLALLLLLLSEKRWATPLLYVAIGLALSSKWTAAFLIFLPPIYYLLTGKRHHLKRYPLYLVIAALTYASTYAMLFINGKTLVDLVILQYQMLAVHRGNRLQMGTPPPLWTLFNFLTGIEGPTTIQTLLIRPSGPGPHPTNITITTSSPETGLSLLNVYNPLTWPISFSASILALYFSAKRDRKNVVIPLGFQLLLWALSLGKNFIWYLLPGIPFGFASLVYVINKLYSQTGQGLTSKIAIAIYIAALIVWSVYVEVPQYVKI